MMNNMQELLRWISFSWRNVLERKILRVLYGDTIRTKDLYVWRGLVWAAVGMICCVFSYSTPWFVCFVRFVRRFLFVKVTATLEELCVSGNRRCADIRGFVKPACFREY